MAMELEKYRLVSNQVLFNTAVNLLRGVNQGEMTGVDSTKFGEVFHDLERLAKDSLPEKVAKELYPSMPELMDIPFDNKR